ncbi:hypothetical protein AB7M16_003877 [Bradyrhizobium sp. USDA 372]
MILARHARPKSAKRVFALDSPGIHVGEVVLRREMTAGAISARRASARAITSSMLRKLRSWAAYAASAALAFSAIAWNAAGSRIARSDSTLRSTVMPDLAKPSINRL